MKQRVREIRRKVIEGYGAKCACCGEDRYEFLALDHVNGGGNAERKKSGYNHTGFHQRLIAEGFPEGYRILCHNCNMAIGAWGYCPHEKEREMNEAIRTVSDH